MRITVKLSSKSIEDAAKKLHEYANSLPEKTTEFVDRLGNKGWDSAIDNLGHVNTGDTFNTIFYKRKSEKSGVLSVGGAAVWIEFGTGVCKNEGSENHPMRDELGMCDWGEYGKGHGADPNGWWYKDGDEYKYTMGIKMNPFMYLASQEMRREVVAIAREVFKT